MSFSHTSDSEKQAPPPQPTAPIDRFLAVMRGSADLFWILASTGTMDDISSSWLSFTGQQEYEARWNGWLDAVYAVDRPALEAFLAQPISVGQPLEHICHIRRKDGIYRLMRLHMFPVYTVAGAVCELVVSGTDITAEHMNDAQIHLALEMAHIGLWRYHLGTQHFVSTEQWKQLYGLPPDAPVTFETFLDMVYPDDRARIEEVKAQARDNSGTAYDSQFRITRPDGSLRWMVSRLQYLAEVPAPSGQLIGSAMDITEAKAAEEQIHQILESITDAFSYVDRQWRYTYVNRRLEKLLGKKREEVVGRSFWDILPETLGTPFEHVYREAMETQQTGHIEGFHPSFRRWLDIYIYPTPDGLSFDLHDITERKHAEKALLESEARFRGLVDSNLLGISVGDQEGNIREANEAFLTLVGYSQKDVEMGRANWRAMTPLEYQELDAQAIKDLQATGVIQPFEKEYVHKDGKRVPVLMGGTLVRRGDPTPQFLAFVLDLTARKEIERQKDLMLSMTGHELKTPLAALKGTLQLLLRRAKRLSASPDSFASELPTFFQGLMECLLTCTRQVDVQTNLINDLLDVSRITAGILQLDLETCDLAPLVRETVEDLRVTAPERSLLLEEPAQPVVMVQADRARISQVITNFITNAVRYSPADQPIHIGITRQENAVRVWVRDQGPGLTKEEQAHLWQRFSQIKGIVVQSGSGKGLGLGLYICQMLIAQHHGEVGVESAPGKGSTFWFTLPVVA